MQYKPRIKFNASIDASGNITQSTTIAGHVGPTISAETGEFHYLLENATTGWEIGAYRPAQPSGSRRTVHSSSENAGAGFSNSTANLICSGIAPPSALVSQTGGLVAADAPINDGLGTIVIGYGANADSTASDSVGMGQSIQLGFHSTSIGGGSIARDAGVAVGRAAMAQSDSYVGVFATGATALGAHAVASASGEVVMGSSGVGIPGNISHIPVAFPVVSSTAGTYDIKAVGENNGVFALETIFSGNGGAFNASNSYSLGAWRRIEGVFMLRATSAADIKVWDVLVLLSPTAVISSSFTDIHHGANNVAVSFSVAATGIISVTVPAIAGQSLVGHLTVRRLFEA